MSEPLLEVEGLEVCYHVRDGSLKALSDVTFDVQPGEILGVVGESGCGKSTLSSALLRLLPPNGEITSGRILLNGRDLLGLSAEKMRQLRGSELVMIFQDPLTSLNPDIHDRDADDRRSAGAHAREARRTPTRFGSGRWRCSSRSGSPTSRTASATTRTSSQAECGSGS